MPNYRLSHILHVDGPRSPLRMLADFLVALVMTATAAGWFLYSFFQWFQPATLILSCAAALLILWLWLYDLRGFAAVLILLLAFFGMIFLVSWEKGFFFTAHDFILDFFSWIAASHTTASLPFHPRFGVALVALFVTAVAFCVTFFIKVLRSGFLCGIFGIIAFMSLSIVETISTPPILPTLIYLSVFLAGCCYFYSGFAFIRRNIGGSYFKWQLKALTLWLVPLTVVLAVSVMGGDLEFRSAVFADKVDNLLSAITLSLSELPQGIQISTPVQGSVDVPMSSSSTVSLGGARTADSSPVFDVSPSPRATPEHGKYYLKLNTFTLYTGNSWHKSGNQPFVATGTKKDASYDQFGDNLLGVEVTLSNFIGRGTVIPAPDKVVSIVSKNPSGIEISKNVFGEYKLSRDISPTNQFAISFNVPNMGLDSGWSMAYSADAAPAVKASFRNMSYRGGDTSIDAFTQLSDDLPQRVISLAGELTAGYNNDFDKAEAICNYLKTTFAYTTSPPSYRGDFVDAFLFEGKAGYCTYFATAMTMLCRANGIPARYIEGYAATAYSPTSQPITVTGRSAHAWCEIYLEDFGWLIFDATAASAIDDIPAAPVAPTPDSTTPIPPEIPEIPDELPEVIAPLPTADGNEDNASADGTWSALIGLLKHAAIILLYVAAVAFVVALPYFYYRLRRTAYLKQTALYRSKSAPRHTLKAYSELLYFAKLLGAEKMAGESPCTHLERLSTVFGAPEDPMWVKAISCVNTAAYSALAPEHDQCKALADVRELAATKAIEKRGQFFFTLMWKRGK